MKARKVLCTVLAAAMTFGAAVCGGAAKADAESGSITLGIWPEDTQTEAIAVHTNSYVPAFNALHPDVEAIPAYYKYAPDTYVALATAGNAPTVFESWYTEPEKLIRNGLVKDITDLLEERGWLDAMSPAIRDLLSDEDGRVYGVPADSAHYQLCGAVCQHQENRPDQQLHPPVAQHGRQCLLGDSLQELF